MTLPQADQVPPEHLGRQGARSLWRASRAWLIALVLVALAATGFGVWFSRSVAPHWVSMEPYQGELTWCETTDEPGGAIWLANAQYGATGEGPVVLSMLWQWDPDPSGIDPGASLAIELTGEVGRYVTSEQSEAGHVWLQMPLDRDELLNPPGRTLLATLEISGQPIASCRIPAADLVGR
ncbi:hypothetical protein [Serinibacter arcticus]|uniref:Uncharacterized protein n=1 Tax=Serinibacter arcticus TaxID=1655435 RepID=A0A4Z1E5U6_9MICO|nr:hypothetical protein [Serinibacter arcticus]TGO05087.1 hypothetical protein SERN_1091 [Serinibacter arcticus]